MKLKSCFCLILAASMEATHREIIWMKRLSLGAGSALLILTLAGCMSGPPSGGGPLQPQRRADAVQGQWFDTSGVAFSNFNGGSFETRANDTKEKLAEGNYRFVSANLVEIDLRSLARGTQSKVNCALVSNGQLNCTSSTGQQFSLTRRSA
jgi:hypothetical protein